MTRKSKMVNRTPRSQADLWFLRKSKMTRKYFWASSGATSTKRYRRSLHPKTWTQAATPLSLFAQGLASRWANNQQIKSFLFTQAKRGRVLRSSTQSLTSSFMSLWLPSIVSETQTKTQSRFKEKMSWWHLPSLRTAKMKFSSFLQQPRAQSRFVRESSSLTSFLIKKGEFHLTRQWWRMWRVWAKSKSETARMRSQISRNCSK